MPRTADLAERILATLGHDDLDRAALRAALAADQAARRAPAILVDAAAVVLICVIANDHYAGFDESIEALWTSLAARSEIQSPALRLLVDAGEFVARYVASVADPRLPLLAERLVQTMADAGVDARLRTAVAIPVLMYFEDRSDAEKIWWTELTLRDVITPGAVGPRLADEWHNRLVRAFDDIGEIARGDALRHEREASGAPPLPSMRARLAVLDAARAHWKVRFDELRTALSIAEPLLSSRDPMTASEWHYLASRLETVEGRLGPALAHARLALRLAIEARYPRAWLGMTVMQQGAVHMASGSFFEAVPFFEEAGRSTAGTQTDYCECLACFARALGLIEAGDHAAGRSELADGFALARRLGWLHFLRASPNAASRLCGLALERNIETEFVRSVIVERRLEADRADLAAWPWPVRIRTLGRFEIEVDAAALSLRGKGARKPIELLQFLIASGGADVTASGALHALWPELDGDNARAAFNVALHRLRKLLRHDAALVLEFGKLGLDSKVVWVDCLAFERLADQVGPQPDESGIRLARRAQALYLGHFLHDDEDHGWKTVHRSRLASKFNRIVRTLARHGAGRGDASAARNLLERAIELDPLAEDLVRELMQLLIEQREQAAALAAFERCRVALARTLGVTPSPATLQWLSRLQASGER